MSYYLVVISWVLKYFFVAFTNVFWKADAAGYFIQFAYHDPLRFLFHALAIAAPAGLVLAGINRGIERTAKIAVPLLFSILIVLAARAISLPGASGGLKFFLKPDFSGFSGKLFLAALGQVFFSIGLGSACLVLYGSYLSSKEAIPRNSMIICLGEMAAALLAGLAIFPALSAFGLPPTGGPSLVFVAFPKILTQMPGGHVLAVVFFGGVLIACLVPALFGLEFFAEPLIYRLGWKRKKAVTVSAAALWILGLPACWNFDLLKRIDLAVTNVLLPICALIAPIAFFWVYGHKRALQSINEGAKRPIGLSLSWAFRFIYPLAIGAILIWGIVTNIL